MAKYIFLLLTTYNVYLVLVFQKSALLLPLAPTVETRATEFRFSSRCPRRHLLTVRAGLDIVAATVFSDRTAEEQSTLYGDCCCYRATYELPNHSLKNSYERARARSTAVKIHLTTAQETANSMEPHLQVSATSSASKEGTETAVALPHSRGYTKEPIPALPKYGLKEKFGAGAELRNALQEKLMSRCVSSCRFERQIGRAVSRFHFTTKN